MVMPDIDPRIDAYIEKSATFAKPVLDHLRQLVHAACPEVKETIKWGFPHFEYKGILCSMASFKQHCAFSFAKPSLMKDASKFLEKSDNAAMGHFQRITGIDDLPSDKKMIAYLKEAVQLNEENIRVAKKINTVKTELVVPVPLQAALNKNKTASEHFDSFSYSAKKEYIEWINEAKTDTTRDKRIQTAVEWISEGKGRNWKYEKKVSK